MTQSQTPPMQPALVKTIHAGIGVAILGFLDATYLTVAHFFNVPVPCSIVNGCEIVTTSSYSVILGVPVALLGSLYYLTLIIAFIIALEKQNRALLRKVSLFTIAGLVASLYFVGLQLFVIHAICLYCMGSALSSTTLFILGLCMLKLLNKANDTTPLASL